MKKIVITLGAILLQCGEVQAQFVRLGVKAGGAVSTITGSGVSAKPKTSPLVGFVGGIYRTIPIRPTNWLSLQIEVLYSQQGYRLSNPDTYYSATLRSHYITLPVLLQSTYKHFFVEIGPQAGYLAGVRELYSFPQPATGTPSVNLNVNPQHHIRWDAALVGGSSYRWTNGFSLELRYAGSLNSIFSTTKARNSVVQILASYPLKKQ